MDLGLSGNIAIVTGAGSTKGFGRAIAITLAREGCDLVINDTSLEGAERTCQELRTLGRRAIPVKADITKRSEVNAMVDRTLEAFGRIDILVNNAGTIGKMEPFVDKPDAEWEYEIDVDLKGALICTKAVLPHMISRRSGKIINITSAVGRSGFANMAPYATAKAGVIGFTKSLAAEVARLGINVNSVAPGVADTQFGIPADVIERTQESLPVGRITQPQDVANMVAFLSSSVASDIVGQTFSVDGGRFMV